MISSDFTYRDITIEHIEAVQVGHATNASTLAKCGIGTKRKVSAYIVHWPDGGTATCDKLADAKRRIDAYLE